MKTNKLFTLLFLLLAFSTSLMAQSGQGVPKPQKLSNTSVTESRFDTVLVEQPNGDVQMRIMERKPNGTRSGTDRTLSSNPSPDLQPKFPGGDEAMTQFISDNLQYPSEDKRKGVSGKVVVEFQLDEEGRVAEAKAMSGSTGTKAMEAEALRVIKLMPNWKPALQGGNPIKTTMYLPIYFNLKAK